MVALRAREQTGRGQVVDTSLIEPLMTLLGPQVAAWDLLGELQPRTGNRSSHNAPRNVYRTADDALGRGLRQRDARSPSACCGSSGAPTSSSSPGSRPAPAAPRTSRRSTARSPPGSPSALARRGAGAFEAGRGGDRADLRRERHRSPTRSSPRSARSWRSTTPSSADQDGERDQPALRDARRDSLAPARAQGADTAEVLAELGVDAAELERLRAEGVV